jgi:protein TonB
MKKHRNRPRQSSLTATPQQPAIGGPLPSFRALLENGKVNRWRVSLGFLLHGLAVAALLLLPLLLTEDLNGSGLGKIIDVFPLQQGDPTGDPTVKTPDQDQEAQPRPRPTDLLIHVHVPEQFEPGSDLEVITAGPNLGLNNGAVPWGVPEGGVEGGAATGLAPHVVPIPPAPGSSWQQPVTVGGRVQPPRLLHRVRPVYPPVAKTARIEGTVVLEALLGTDGRVQRIQVKSGPAILVPAAREAVAQWVYEPTYLNEQPVAVLLRVAVQFRLR